ncbi:hypothetical protein VNO77_34232 [Canavalia gladiata]|uniref:Uncharacterized protein n=1 Tax=Canavalia gladiata TaxID=3824 RepID=A0AAN9PX25_CANGL
MLAVRSYFILPSEFLVHARSPEFFHCLCWVSPLCLLSSVIALSSSIKGLTAHSATDTLYCRSCDVKELILEDDRMRTEHLRAETRVKRSRSSIALTSYYYNVIFPTAQINSLAIGMSTFAAYSHNSITGMGPKKFMNKTYHKERVQNIK